MMATSASRSAEVCSVSARPRPIQWAACAFTLMIGLVSGPCIARADSGSDFWNDSLLHASRCQDALNETVSEGTRCLLGNGMKLLLDEGLRSADAYGKRTFGPRFQVVGDLNYSSVSDEIVGIGGDIDVVMPFTGAGLSLSRPGFSSFFVQQGVTRSWDESGEGLFRNDLRHGVVRRFRVSAAAGADIVGISAFHLLNTEYGHRVLAPGIDYTGRWGTGSLRYFIPTTGWRPGSIGFEERALEGIEFGMRFDVTTTVGLDSVAYRWKADDGSNLWESGIRLELDWRPHTWLSLDATYDVVGANSGSTTLKLALQVPLGTSGDRPQWGGVGRMLDNSPPSVDDLWRPIDDVGPLRVATRTTADALVGDVQVRFLQHTVMSGETVQLEVSVSSPAPEEIRLVLRLIPGRGPNPAVPGEDFVDEPVETTIPKGNRSNTVSIPLLRNDAMTESRSLDVIVSLAS